MLKQVKSSETNMKFRSTLNKTADIKHMQNKMHKLESSDQKITKQNPINTNYKKQKS